MASQQLVLAGGNNITLSQSMDALSLSATVTISGGNSYSAGVTSLGNTSGNTGLVSQQLVLAGGNNVTLSGSINAGSATITISGPTGGGGAFSAGVSNIGNTLGSTGVVTDLLVLAGGNNITLSQSTNGDSATITISAAAIGVNTLSIWNNKMYSGSLLSSVSGNIFNLVELDPKNDIFPGNMTVSTVYIAISQSSNLSAAHSGTLKLGIYTRNASTLSIFNSASTTWGFAANASNSRLMKGLRWITLDATLWSASLTFSQTRYWLGMLMHTSGGEANYSYEGFRYLGTDQRSGTFGVSLSSGDTSMGWVPFIGESVSSIASNGAMPTSIQLSELDKVGIAGYIPHIVFENISSNF